MQRMTVLIDVPAGWTIEMAAIRLERALMVAQEPVRILEVHGEDLISPEEDDE